MGRTAAKRQRASFFTTQNAEQKQTTIAEANPTATRQQLTPPSLQNVKLQPTISEDDVRLRAYEIYLKRGDNPGDEVGDWLRAERELLQME